MIFLVSSLFILFSCKDKVIFKKKEVVLIKAPISFYPNRTFPLELSEDKSLIQFKWKNNELYFVDKNQILFKKYFGKIPHNSITKTTGNCQYNSEYQPGKKLKLEIS